MTHQFLRVTLHHKQYKVVGTVDYEDPVKRRFYVEKMVGILEKKDLMVKTRVVKQTPHHKEYVEILAKTRPLLHFKGVAWIHPKGGGDDRQLNIKTQAENLTVAKKQVREHLLKLGTHKNMVDDFTLKQVKK